MKCEIEVKNADEAAQLKAGLDDPVARAFTKIVGHLNQLPHDQARWRVIRAVAILLDVELR